jgi:hypothetical protein
MKNDSAEATNVAIQHPEIVKRLQNKYQQWITEVYNQ